MNKLLKELATLEAKATPGPWIPEGKMQDAFGSAGVRICASNRVVDASLIITMRNALPELLREWKRYRDENTRLLSRMHERTNDRDAALARAEKAEADLLAEQTVLAGFRATIDERDTWVINDALKISGLLADLARKDAEIATLSKKILAYEECFSKIMEVQNEPV